MKVCIEQFLGLNHSWSCVGQNIARALHQKGHEVHVRSTNGYNNFPKDLQPLIKENLDNNYDMQISYTAMINFQKYLSHGKKNRFGIWNYEFTVLPAGFPKNIQFLDMFLPSSNFSKEIFKNNGIPEEKMKVVKHGFAVEQYKNAKPMELKTNKKIKILANIAQPHQRKNLPGLLEAFGKAFSKKDDVCLVLKVVDKIPTSTFEVSFSKCFSEFKKQFPNHAEVLIIKDFIDDIASLYKACDIVFTMAHTECFWLPGLEGLACNKIIISPRYGGQLDYLNDSNSLLVDGKVTRAPSSAHYWSSSIYSGWFNPFIEDAVMKLKLAVSNYDELQKKFTQNSLNIIDDYTWDKVAEEILLLCEK